MDKTVENMLAEFVLKAAERFNLSCEDALAAVCHTKVANNLAANGIPDNRTTEDLCNELFDQISKAC